MIVYLSRLHFMTMLSNNRRENEYRKTSHLMQEYFIISLLTANKGQTYHTFNKERSDIDTNGDHSILQSSSHSVSSFLLNPSNKNLSKRSKQTSSSYRFHIEIIYARFTLQTQRYGRVQALAAEITSLPPPPFPTAYISINLI